MKIKRRMRYLALFIAAVVVFSMLPTNLLESYAYTPTEHSFRDDDGDGYCDECGFDSSKSWHTSSSSSSSCSHSSIGPDSADPNKIVCYSCGALIKTLSSSSSVTSEESKPGISPEEQKRLDDEALQQKLQEMYKKNSRVAVGGRYVTSTLPGAYEATGVKGKEFYAKLNSMMF